MWEICTTLKVEVGGTYTLPYLKFYFKFNLPNFVTMSLHNWAN